MTNSSPTDLVGQNASEEPLETPRRLLPTSHNLVVMWPVSGLEKPERPTRVANVEFDVLRPAKRRKLLRQMGIPRASQGRKVIDIFFDRYQGHVYAETTVKSRDVDAAEELARSQIRVVVEIVNYFADMEMGPRAGVYVEGDIGSTGVITLTHDVWGRPPVFPRLRYSRQGPMMTVSLSKLKRRTGFKAAERLLTGNLTEAESRLLRALRWAGRASVERDPGHSLTFFVFALESALIGPQAGPEIGYRLAVRAANLLANTRAKKRQVFDEIRRLYGLRSEVAHRGKLDFVSATDRLLARDYAKGAIMLLLTRPTLFRQVRKDKEMDAWFDARVL